MTSSISVGMSFRSFSCARRFAIRSEWDRSSIVLRMTLIAVVRRMQVLHCWKVSPGSEQMGQILRAFRSTGIARGSSSCCSSSSMMRRVDSWRYWCLLLLLIIYSRVKSFRSPWVQKFVEQPGIWNVPTKVPSENTGYIDYSVEFSSFDNRFAWTFP